MKATVHLHARTLALIGLATLALILSSATPACSSNNAAPPSTTSNSSTTTSSGGGTTTTTTSTTTTTTGTGGTGGGSADGGPDSGEAGPPCVSDGGATGCFSCPPQNNAQFLTQCAPSGDPVHHTSTTPRGAALPGRRRAPARAVKRLCSTHRGWLAAIAGLRAAIARCLAGRGAAAAAAR